MRQKIIRTLPVFFLAFFAIVYYWPQVTGSAIPFSADPGGSDLVGVSEPYFAYSAEKLHKGEIPLWTTRLGGGYPQFAEGGTAFFYPPVMVLYALFSPLTAFLLLFPLHALIASVSMYWYARVIGFHRWGALLSGLIFAYSGYFVGHQRHLNHLFMASSLLPFALAGITRWYQTRQFIWPIFTGVITAIMLLSGSVQTIYHGALLMGLLLLAMAIKDVRRCFRANAFISGEESLTYIKAITKSLRVQVRHYALCITLLLTTFTLLTAVQLIPSLELTRHTSRTTEGTKLWSEAFPFHPENLITFISPFARGNPAFGSYNYSWENIVETTGLYWENIGYVGLVPLMFALAAIVLAIRRRDWRIIFWMSICILGITIVLGKYLPVYQWLWHYLPFFHMFRVPGRYLLWVDTALAILAGYTLNILIRACNNNLKTKISPFSVSLIVLAIIGTTMFDLSTFNYHFNAMDRLMTKAWARIPQAVPFLAQSNGKARFISVFSGEDFSRAQIDTGGWQNDLQWVIQNREVLPPDYSLRFGVESFDHYTPLTLKRHDAFVNLIYNSLVKSAAIATHITDPIITLNSRNIELMGMANIKYLLSFNTLVNAHLTLDQDFNFPYLMYGMDLIDPIFHGENALDKKLQRTLFVYHNDTVLPRVYSSTSVRSVNTYENAASLLASSLQPLSETIVEGADLSQMSLSHASAKIIETHEGFYQIQTESDGDAFLILNESFYPGWEARIDGTPTTIYPTNLAFQGITIPKGTHTVEFAFTSESFRTGARISLFGWLLVIVLLTYTFIQKRACAQIKDNAK